METREIQILDTKIEKLSSSEKRKVKYEMLKVLSFYQTWLRTPSRVSLWVFDIHISNLLLLLRLKTVKGKRVLDNYFKNSWWDYVQHRLKLLG